MTIFYDNLHTFVAANQCDIETIKTQYLELLSQLTNAPLITNEDFLLKLDEISKMGEIIIAYVIDDPSYPFSSKIIASGTVIFEPKIIRGGKYVGHIEDIVVSKSYRKQGISQEILQRLMAASRRKGCYKAILDCECNVNSVYEKAGFTEKGVQMAYYLDH